MAGAAGKDEKRMFDRDKLREDLKAKLGIGMFGGSPIAMMELMEIEDAPEEKLAEIAKRNGLDWMDYVKLG